jgi:hypothetical protein
LRLQVLTHFSNEVLLEFFWDYLKVRPLKRAEPQRVRTTTKIFSDLYALAYSAKRRITAQKVLWNLLPGPSETRQWLPEIKASFDEYRPGPIL